MFSTCLHCFTCCFFVNAVRDIFYYDSAAAGAEARQVSMSRVNRPEVWISHPHEIADLSDILNAKYAPDVIFKEDPSLRKLSAAHRLLPEHKATPEGVLGMYDAIAKFQMSFTQGDIETWKESQTPDVVKLGFFAQRSFGYGPGVGTPLSAHDYSSFEGTDLRFTPLVQEIAGDMAENVPHESVQIWRVYSVMGSGDVVWFYADVVFDLIKPSGKRIKFASRATGVCMNNPTEYPQDKNDWRIVMSHWSLEKVPMLWFWNQLGAIDLNVPLSGYSGIDKSSYTGQDFETDDFCVIPFREVDDFPSRPRIAKHGKGTQSWDDSIAESDPERASSSSASDFGDESAASKLQPTAALSSFLQAAAAHSSVPPDEPVVAGAEKRQGPMSTKRKPEVWISHPHDIGGLSGRLNAMPHGVMFYEDHLCKLSAGYRVLPEHRPSEQGVLGMYDAIARFQISFTKGDIGMWKESQTPDVVKLGFFAQRSFGYGPEVTEGRDDSFFEGTHLSFTPLVQEIAGDMADNVKDESFQIWRVYSVMGSGDVVWFYADVVFDLLKISGKRIKFASRATGVCMKTSNSRWKIVQSHWSLEKAPMLWFWSQLGAIHLNGALSGYSGIEKLSYNGDDCDQLDFCVIQAPLIQEPFNSSSNSSSP